MRGTITSYDTTTNTGTIKGDDGSVYLFARHDIHTGSEILEGQEVDFVPAGSTANQIVILSSPPKSDSSVRSDLNDAAAAFGTAANSAINSIPGADSYDFQSALLTYTGRMRRQHFWISFLIIFGISVLLGWIPFIGWILSVALLWPSTCITIKRLHDMGKTGWLALTPYIGWVVSIGIMIMGGAGAFLSAAVTGDANPAALMSVFGSFALAFLIMLVTSFGFLIWIGITDSQPGDNQYGPNPKGL